MTLVRHLYPFIFLLFLCFLQQPTLAVQPYSSTQNNPVADIQNCRIFPELKGKGLRSLTEGLDRTMWFGVDQGVIHYNGINWTPYTQQNGIWGSPVDVLLTTSTGDIYAGTSAGISRYNGNSWQRVFPPTKNLSWPIHDLIEASDHSLWAATSWGALHISPTNTTLYTTSQVAKSLQPHLPYLKIQPIPKEITTARPWQSGIGIQLTSGSHQHAIAEKAQGLIWAIAPGSPAEKSGLQIGDKIKAINGQKGITQHSLNGPVHSTLSLKTESIQSSESNTLNITRERITGSFADFRLIDICLRLLL